MLIKGARIFVAQLAREGGNEELAKFIESGPEDAVRRAARILMRGLGLGKVDEKALKEAEKIRKQASLAGTAPQEDRKKAPTYLDEYLLALNMISAAGSERGYLLLDGFLHTDDCTSLWVFDLEQAVSKDGIELKIDDFGGSEPYVILKNAGVHIYLFPRLDRAKLLELNEQLGRGRGLPAELSIDDKPRVQFIYEERLETVRKTVKKKKVSGNRTREIAEDINEDLGIGQAPEGIAAMYDSLRPALEARAKYADTLKKTVEKGLKNASK